MAIDQIVIDSFNFKTVGLRISEKHLPIHNSNKNYGNFDKRRRMNFLHPPYVLFPYDQYMRRC